MLVADEANRWNWDDLFEVLLGRVNNRVRVKTPVGRSMLILERKERSFDKKQLEKKDYDNRPHRTPQAISNNYI